MRPKRLTLGCVAAAATLALAAPSTHAATIGVNFTGCTLDDALRSAQTDTSWGGNCTPGSGADTIELQAKRTYDVGFRPVSDNAPNVSHPDYVDATGAAHALLPLSTNITIDGNGATIRRENGEVREFRLLSIAGATLRVSDLTLSGGIVRSNYNPPSALCAGGGGILVRDGTLELDRVTVRDNTALNEAGALGNVCGGGGGVRATNSTVTVTHGVVTSNRGENSGAGIELDGGALTLRRSTVSDNRAETTQDFDPRGGGLMMISTGTLTIDRSTFSGNVAGRGGGLQLHGATAAITNSTISGNRSTSQYDPNTGRGGSAVAGAAVGGPLTLRNSTITANVAEDAGSVNSAGGVDVIEGGTIDAVNSIIAGNTGGGSITGAVADCRAALSLGPGGRNLVGFGTGCPAGGGDVTVQPGSVATTVLNPLSAAGGPTRTHPLRPLSPALDAGDAATCAAPPVGGIDQRGNPRPFGTACDIGAYEGVTDVVDPVATITLDPAQGDLPDGAYDGPVRVKVSAADEAGGSGIAEINCVLDPPAPPAGIAAGTPCAFTGPGAVVPARGAHTVYASARDGAGNVSPLVTRTFTVNPAPDTRILSTPPAGAEGATARFTFDAVDEPASFECSVDGGAFTGCVSPHTTAASSPGAHTFAVRAAARGRTDPTPASASFTILKAPDLDSDSDRLPDRWEESGDLNADGVMDLDLPAMGARSDHKDLFVEVDAMQGQQFDATAAQRVVAAFAGAPVTNPDGVPGIALHIDNGPSSPMAPGRTWGALSRHDDNLPYKLLMSLFGDFDPLKAANFDAARRRVFRYAIVGDEGSDGFQRVGGAARASPSSDFAITLGSGCGGVKPCSGTLDQQTGTFVHELGHTLGLRHGGGDATNFKRNYFSLMNYLFAYGMPTASGLLFDLSRYGPAGIGALDAAGLVEAEGVETSAPGALKHRTLADACTTLHPLNAPVDWNCNNRIDAAPVPATAFSGRTTSYDDWANLQYAGGTVGLAPAPGSRAPERRFTPRDLLPFAQAVRGDRVRPRLTLTAPRRGRRNRLVTIRVVARDNKALDQIVVSAGRVKRRTPARGRRTRTLTLRFRLTAATSQIRAVAVDRAGAPSAVVSRTIAIRP